MAPNTTTEYSYVSGCLDEIISVKDNNGGGGVYLADDVVNRLASLQSQIDMLTQELSLRRKAENREAMVVPSPSTITSELTEESELGDDGDYQSIKTAPSIKSITQTGDKDHIAPGEEPGAEVGIGDLDIAASDSVQRPDRSCDFEKDITAQAELKNTGRLGFEDYTLTRRIPSTVVEEMVSPVDTSLLTHTSDSDMAMSSPPPPPPLPEKNLARKMSEDKSILPMGVKEARRAWIERCSPLQESVAPVRPNEMVPTPARKPVNQDEGSNLVPILSQAQKEGKDVEALLEYEASGKEASDQVSSDKGLKDAVKDGFDLDLFSFIGSTKKVEDRQASSTKDYWGSSSSSSSFLDMGIPKKRTEKVATASKPILGMRDWDATPLSNGLARRRSSAKDHDNKLGLQSPGRRRSSAKEDNYNNNNNITSSSPARRGSEIRMVPFSARRMSEKEEVAMNTRSPQRRPSVREEELTGRVSRIKDMLPGSWKFKPSSPSTRNPSVDDRMYSADVG